MAISAMLITIWVILNKPKSTTNNILVLLKSSGTGKERKQPMEIWALHFTVWVISKMP